MSRWLETLRLAPQAINLFDNVVAVRRRADESAP